MIGKPVHQPAIAPVRIALVSASGEGSEAEKRLAAALPDAELLWVSDFAECACISPGKLWAIVVESQHPGFCLEALGDLVQALASVPVVVWSEHEDPELAQAAMEVGAQDCLSSGGPHAEGDPLARALRHARWRKSHAARPLQAAGLDPLTGLPGRASFEEQFVRSLHQCDRAGRQLAVLLVSVNGIGAINDGVGHDVGDLVLSSVASRITGGTRRSDSLARVAGSTFAVLLHDVSGEHAPARVAGYLMRMLEEPIAIHGSDYWASSNIGIAMFPRDGQNVPRLLAHAEVALHQARTRGNGEYRFHSEEMNSRARKRLVLENNLRRALQRGGLRVAYQPQVETGSGAVVGCEALARWSDPELGEVSPADFIPVAEQTGLIVPLGEWVLQTATSQLAQWKRQGLRGVRMSVNVSAFQVARGDFSESVARALWDSGLPPEDLVLEVTESALIEDEGAAIESLGELARRGVAISLDDFGTGFSSLSFLKRFPLEQVKIDRIFMQELVFDPDDRAIVIAILSIAKQLRLSVVAEGVETEVQRAFLSEHGCDEIQGFLISPGLPPEAFFERFGPAVAQEPERTHA